MKVKKVSGYSAGYPKKKGAFAKLGDAVRSLLRRRPGKPQVVGKYLVNDPEYPEPRLEGEPPVDETEPELTGDPAVDETEPKLTGDPAVDIRKPDGGPAVMGRVPVPPEERD